MGYGRRRQSSILEAFTLNPLPYPVLLILAVIAMFLSISSYFTYESLVEDAEEQFGWILMVIPIVLLIAVHCLSSIENPESLFGRSPYDRRYRTHQRPPEGASPWGVALVIVLLLVMVNFQSTFQDGWFP